MDDEYTCAECCETFGKTRSDEDVMKECDEVFGADDANERVCLCDDCYKVLMCNFN